MSARLLDAIDATWPAAETLARDGWVFRRGGGGGKRVSAASLPMREGVDVRAEDLPDLDMAEYQMRAWKQPPLFRIAPWERGLDRRLAMAGYKVIDPVAIYSAPLAALKDTSDETARVIRASTDVAIVREIWAQGGIGDARRAVMDRAAGEKVTLLARLGDRPVGCAFVARDGEVAMIHAIEVLPEARRQGIGEMLLRGGANWADGLGAQVLALAVVKDNRPACALYEKLGMSVGSAYHYRIRGG